MDHWAGDIRGWGIFSTVKKYTLVTGSSSGIGKEIALQLCATGKKVIFHGTSDDKLRSLSFDPSNLIWKYDLNECHGLSSSLDGFIKLNGVEVESFVHCAGVDYMSPIKSLNTDINNKIYNINFFSAVEIVKALISKKINNQALKGVVFISSNSSGFGAKGMSMYVSSKSALDGFMKSAAVELAPNVRFNSVLPGAVRTDMTEVIFQNDDVSYKLLSPYPMGAGNPSQIGEVVLFLLSESASWVNGQQLVVDGGRSINISAG